MAGGRGKWNGRARLTMLSLSLATALVVVGGTAIPTEAAGTGRGTPGIPPGHLGLSRASGPTPFASSPCERNADQETEPSVAVDPNDRRHIVAAWMQDGALGIVVAVTKDEGRSWTRTVLPREVDCTGPMHYVADARIAIGTDGIVYVVTLPVGASVPSGVGIYVHRSLDGGMTWQPPVEVGVHGDFPSIAAVPDRPGEAVVVWAQRDPFQATMIARTDDAGATWSRPHVVRLPDPGTLDLDRVAALTGDRLAIVYTETPASVIVQPASAGPMMAIHSTDGGATWSTPVRVSLSASGTSFPDIASTPAGALYAVVQDPAQDGACAISVSRSDDGGATWSVPEPVATQRPIDSNPPLPPANIGASDGRVLVLYDDGDGSTAQVRIALSGDGGATWIDQVISEPFDAVHTDPDHGVGDYQQISVSGDVFAAVLVMGAPYAVDGPTDVYVALGELPGRPDGRVSVSHP